MEDVGSAVLSLLVLGTIIGGLVLISRSNAASRTRQAGIAELEHQLIQSTLAEGERLEASSNFFYAGTGARAFLTSQHLRVVKFGGPVSARTIAESWAFALGDISGVAYTRTLKGQLELALNASGRQYLFVSGASADAAFADSLNRAVGFRTRSRE